MEIISLLSPDELQKKNGEKFAIQLREDVLSGQIVQFYR